MFYWTFMKELFDTIYAFNKQGQKALSPWAPIETFGLGLGKNLRIFEIFGFFEFLDIFEFFEIFEIS